MINQRGTLTTHALDTRNCDLKMDDRQREFRSSFLNRTQSSLDIKKGATQLGFLRFENHELHSAFKRYSHKNFPQIENPKLGSLISTFSNPRELKNASSESLADFHKKEFRKKFQGNEHYLRKHLYREDLDKCSLAQLSEHAQSYLTSMSINRPAIKYEKFQTSCYDNDDMNMCPFRQYDEEYKDKDTMSYETRKPAIWNPFCPRRDNVETKLELNNREKQNKVFDDLERLNSNSKEIESKDKDKIKKINSEDTDEEAQHKADDLNSTNDSCHLDEDTHEETKVDESTEQKNNEVKRIDPNSTELETKTKDVDRRPSHDISKNITTSSTQSAFMSREYYPTLQPWLFQPTSMLSSLSMKEMTSRTAPLTSISRYQNLTPLALPYGIPSSTQSRPRVTPGFTCEFCGKVYCRKYVLKIHMRTHTGFKPLRCKFCDKSFSDPSNMKKHVKLHETENTVHKCEHCGRNFVRYRGLLNHIKSKHTEPMNMGIII